MKTKGILGQVRLVKKEKNAHRKKKTCITGKEKE